MISDENLPDGWTAASSTTEYDEMMGREYESRRYEHEDSGAEIFINEVNAPEDFEGWGYEVVVEALDAETGTGTRRGPFEDLDDARDAAVEYMEQFEA